MYYNYDYNFIFSDMLVGARSIFRPDMACTLVLLTRHFKVIVSLIISSFDCTAVNPLLLNLSCLVDCFCRWMDLLGYDREIKRFLFLQNLVRSLKKMMDVNHPPENDLA